LKERRIHFAEDYKSITKITAALIDLVEVADFYLKENNETQIDSRYWRSQLQLFEDGKRILHGKKEKKTYESQIV